LAFMFTRPDSVTGLSWQELLSMSVVTAGQLAAVLPVEKAAVAAVIRTYPLRINPYALSLIKEKDDPLWRQAVPDLKELDPETGLSPDPLWEEAQSPVPYLIHRYPDRVVFMVSNQCAMYCRHCMRKRGVGRPAGITETAIDAGIAYISDQPAVKDVILSGGDPLLLEDDRLGEILKRLHRIGHVELLRIHTRTPCTLPQRITGPLVEMLKRFFPLYVNIQFNHPDEITPRSEKACRMLANAGIPLGCQTVLLKGVNDDPGVMMRLMRALLRIRVKPYYLHHTDPVRGTRHFRTSVDKGLAIMQALRGNLSGMGVPSYMIDLPEGGGKVPLLPAYVLGRDKDRLTVRNYQGKVFAYPL